MAKKIENWNPTCNRFVAFIDIMGFRDFVYRNSHSDVNDKLNLLYPYLASIAQRAKSTSNDKIVKMTARPVIFSDSIILASSDDSEQAAEDMLYASWYIITNSIGLGIPTKGAIACGEETADFKKSLHFGRPLIDAYELQNELQLYGVVLHHTMEKRLSQLKIIKDLEDKHIFKYLLPMKSGKITHYILDWTYQLGKGEDPVNLVSNLFNSVSGKPRIYVDNTLEFINWVTTKKAELAQKRKKKP
jgi:hypothetical protein